MASAVAVVGRAQTGTRTLYESFWQAKGSSVPMRIMAISDSLTNLAEVHNRKTSSTLLSSYVASLEDLTPEDIILAFTRAQDEENYWPTPSRLRELCGREPAGDPLEREAIAAFNAVLSKMRGFGWELKPRLGRIIATSGPDGRLLAEPLRAPTEEPNLPLRSMQALALLGWGDWHKGVALLRDHPAVKSVPAGEELGQYQVNALKQADELKRRWVEAYRQNLAAVEARGGRQ